jgi:hypothetical protein
VHTAVLLQWRLRDSRYQGSVIEQVVVVVVVVVVVGGGGGGGGGDGGGGGGGRRELASPTHYWRAQSSLLLRCEADPGLHGLDDACVAVHARVGSVGAVVAAAACVERGRKGESLAGVAFCSAQRAVGLAVRHALHTVAVPA